MIVLLTIKLKRSEDTIADLEGRTAEKAKGKD